MFPFSIMWYLQFAWKHILSLWWAIQIFFSQCIFHIWLHITDGFLNELKKSWESLVTIQLPSDGWVVFEQLNLKNSLLFFFYTNIQKKERGSRYPDMDMSPEKDQRVSKSPYMEMSRENGQKDAYIRNKTQLQNQSSTILHKKIITSSRYQLSFSLTHG